MQSEPITSFRGHWKFLSNFFVEFVIHDTYVWISAEHAYQAAKSLDEKYKTKVLFAKTPKEAKNIGKTAVLRPDWKLVRVKIMEDVVRTKFEQKSYLQKMLLETGDRLLVEGNWWRDRFWGQCPVGNGENHLGRILMKIREEYRNGLVLGVRD